MFTKTYQMQRQRIHKKRVREREREGCRRASCAPIKCSFFNSCQRVLKQTDVRTDDNKIAYGLIIKSVMRMFARERKKERKKDRKKKKSKY